MSSLRTRFLEAARCLVAPSVAAASEEASPTFQKPPSAAEAGYGWNLIVPKRLFDVPDRDFWESECRRLNFSERLTGDEILCRTLGRYRMIVNARDESLALNLIAEGFWEIWISCLIVRAVQPGMVCIDAGANIGYYTVMMAEQAGLTGKVIAAEPVPETFRYLTKNAQLNDFHRNIELLNVAFGAEAGTATLLMPKGEPKNASMFAYERCLDTSHLEKMEASVQPIDALNLPRVDFVKIDVEGAERLVWKGMQATIARSPDIQIVMEVNASRSADIDDFLQEIVAIFPLRMAGYDGNPAPLTIEQVKADPNDVMLYLSNV
jgi:FkbM family methyltransferase